MTLLTKPIDFQSMYFNKDAFTAITGYPTYSTIRRLEDEVLRAEQLDVVAQLGKSNFYKNLSKFDTFLVEFLGFGSKFDEDFEFDIKS